MPLTEADWCCGSAGTYNVTQPELSAKLLERKVGHITQQRRGARRHREPRLSDADRGRPARARARRSPSSISWTCSTARTPAWSPELELTGTTRSCSRSRSFSSRPSWRRSWRPRRWGDARRRDRRRGDSRAACASASIQEKPSSSRAWRSSASSSSSSRRASRPSVVAADVSVRADGRRHRGHRAAVHRGCGDHVD